MKKSFYLLLFTLPTIVFMACHDDFLDTTPKGQPTLANFWKTQTDVDRATNSLYLMNDFQGIYGRGMFLYSLIASDDFVVGKPKGQIEEIKDFITEGSGSYTRDIWPMHYQLIKRANDLLTFVPDMNISDDAKNFALGNAYFMRGLAYFQLSLLYGDDSAGIPVVDEKTVDFDIERPNSVTASYTFAAGDFSKAATLLPLFSDLDLADYGKAHKNAAYAYLAKTHLHNARSDQRLRQSN
jgi:hypothetical protein